MRWLRPIDVWFQEQVLPHEASYVRHARQWAKNDQEAADLVQEAYLQLLQLENWSAIRHPRAYATTTIRNLVLQRVRRDRIVAITDIPAPQMENAPDDTPCVFEAVAAREALQGLLAEMASLPPVCRQVIAMRKFEDRSPRDIALELGISVSTVETHLARGMRQLMAWRRRSAQMPTAALNEMLPQGDRDETLARGGRAREKS